MEAEGAVEGVVAEETARIRKQRHLRKDVAKCIKNTERKRSTVPIERSVRGLSLKILLKRTEVASLTK